MNEPVTRSAAKAVDSIQERLTNYACNLRYEGLAPEVIHAAKVRIIDTVGILIGGFFGEPCRIARNLAAQMPDAGGATVLGTRMKTTPDMAAFVNATTVCYPVLTDCYHFPGADQGHPSENITPLLGVAEQAGLDGRDFIAGVVLAYEVCLRFSDFFRNPGFDNTNFVCLAIAIGAGKLWKFSPAQLAHAISMAVVPNNILRQTRRDHISMFKAAAPGQAARAGVFAAMLARAGMEGPHLPFEGKAGWCEHIARQRFSLDTLGGNGTPFKIMETLIKNRPSEGKTIAPILAAEKLAPLKNLREVQKIIVETHKKAKDEVGSGERPWNPQSREDADHSIPYVVAATLMDGTVTLGSFNDAHLWNPELRALLQKVEILEDQKFTQAYVRLPVEHRTRITIVMTSGERLVAESGGDQDDLSTPKSDAQIEEKFRGLTEDYLGAKQVNVILERLWRLEDVTNVAEIPPALVIG